MVKRLLVAGLGSIGMRHARLARSLIPGVEIVALRRSAKDDECANAVDRCVTTIQEALDFQPDAAVIANPSSAHIDVAMPLARAGVHLLMEKPIASRVDGVAALIATCAGRGSVLMVGYNLRYLPSLQRYRELLRAGRIGRVLSVRAEVGQYLPTWRPGVDYRGTVTARAALGGGALLELSHELDYMRWLFGEASWVSAVVRKQSELDIDVEDTAYVTIAFGPGPGAPEVLASVCMDITRHDATRTCTAIGDGGSLRWNAAAGTVEVFERGASAWETVFSHRVQKDESYIAEWQHFLECIAGRRSVAVTGADGLAVLRIVTAARESSSKGKVVTVGGDAAESDIHR